MTAKDQKDDNPLGHIVAVLPIVIPQTRPNWYDPHYWNDIVVALQEAQFNSRAAVRLLQSKFSHDGWFNTLIHSTLEGWYSRTVDDSGNKGIVWHEAVLLKFKGNNPCLMLALESLVSFILILKL